MTAAKCLAAPNSVSQFLRSADAAAAHAACLLGIVTHAANNFRSPSNIDGGGNTTTVSRDSVDRPRGVSSCAQTRAGSCPPPTATTLPLPSTTSVASRSVAPWRAPTPQIHANRLRKAASDCALVRRVEEIGAQLKPSTTKAPAASRLHALAERIRAKQNAGG